MFHYNVVFSGLFYTSFDFDQFSPTMIQNCWLKNKLKINFQPFCTISWAYWKNEHSLRILKWMKIVQNLHEEIANCPPHTEHTSTSWPVKNMKNINQIDAHCSFVYSWFVPFNKGYYLHEKTLRKDRNCGRINNKTTELVKRETIAMRFSPLVWSQSFLHWETDRIKPLLLRKPHYSGRNVGKNISS